MPVIGTMISHYKVLSRVGAGGMGVVYEAEDTRLGRKVAIKFLPDEASADAEAIQRFQREARAISSLNHPHICTLYDIGVHESKHFMVMELLDGQPLRDRMSRGALPLEDVLDLGAQLADALDAAHAQGIVHRDIKPANIFITRRGLVKVLDFGVAKLGLPGHGSDPLGSTMGGSDQLTTMGTTIGTVSYMSPEQARGQEIDARSDLFSAGVVLYEMATGQLPFQGATVATIFEGLLTKEPAKPSELKAGLPAPFDHIISKALEKDRETRYQGAAELRADLKRLKRLTESGGVAATTSRGAGPSGPASSGPASWRKPVLIGAPLLTALAVGGFLLYKSIATPALAERDTVILTPVVNRTGDTMFDDTLGDALALQLRQSPFLSVVPDQQVQAMLRMMAFDPTTPITADVGREVCQRAGAKALLGGTIAMLGRAYVITLRAQDCVQGSVFAEEQGQADTKESVLAVLGTTVSAFREKLGESLASIQRYDAKIEEGTTKSLEALKAYSEGLRTRRMATEFDSVPFFKRAIDLDPEFALAYARLGTVYANLGQPDEARKMTARAYELRGKVSEVERYYIEARYFTTVEPDLQKAIDTYRVWLSAYPNDYSALVNSAQLMRQRGENAAALVNLEAATRVAPDQPTAWSNLANAYLEDGRLEEARKTLEAALKLQDTTAMRIPLFVIATLLQDRALADAQVAAVRGRRDEVDFLGARIQAAVFEGRMKEAAQLTTEWQGRMEAASRRPQVGQRVIGLAVEEALLGMTDQARALVAYVIDEELMSPNLVDEQLVVAAITRDAEAARELLPQAIEQARKANGKDPEQVARERALRALALLAEGKPAEAVPLLEPVIYEARRSEQVAAWSVAQLQVGNYAAAEKGLVFMADEKTQRGFSATTPFALANLARAQAALGKTAEARKTYERFFKLWQHADPDVPLLVKAREEFSKLGS